LENVSNRSHLVFANGGESPNCVVIISSMFKNAWISQQMTIRTSKYMNFRVVVSPAKAYYQLGNDEELMAG
jgi:hypothetical protein